MYSLEFGLATAAYDFLNSSSASEYFFIVKKSLPFLKWSCAVWTSFSDGSATAGCWAKAASPALRTQSAGAAVRSNV
jgi:hypothetical protein